MNRLSANRPKQLRFKGNDGLRVAGRGYKLNLNGFRRVDVHDRPDISLFQGKRGEVSNDNNGVEFLE